MKYFSLDECVQTNGDTLMNNVAKTLQLVSEFSNCNGAVKYYMREHQLNTTSVCKTLIDEVLEKLPGTVTQKTPIRQAYTTIGIEKATTVVADICKCTCTNRNLRIENHDPGKTSKWPCQICH